MILAVTTLVPLYALSWQTRWGRMWFTGVRDHLILSVHSFSLIDKFGLLSSTLQKTQAQKHTTARLARGKNQSFFMVTQPAHTSKDARTHTDSAKRWKKTLQAQGSSYNELYWPSTVKWLPYVSLRLMHPLAVKHPPVVYGVSGSVMHRGAAVLPVHAWRGTHSSRHLRRHAAHVRAYSRTVRPSTHLPRAYSTRRHASIRSPAALTRHGVHGAAYTGTTGVVGVGHPCIAGLPGVTWKVHR